MEPLLFCLKDRASLAGFAARHSTLVEFAPKSPIRAVVPEPGFSRSEDPESPGASRFDPS